ncbi:MAG TPA: GNAT family N-acetyltransferase [Pseudorhizobium sp.]|nr:GNAT family N-acetyltransferase [Pseudorhizobium sp.]
MIVLETERLRLRSWIESDRHLFREINADTKVMEFFAFRRSHAEADALLEKINSSIRETGLGFYCLELKETSEPVGFCGLSLANMPDIFPAETVEIGWRLATRFWGHGYVTEAGRALLDFAFREKSVPAVLAFAVTENRRSTAVMERIGMRPCRDMDFDHPRVPETHPHLKRHVVYAAVADELKRP